MILYENFKKIIFNHIHNLLIHDHIINLSKQKQLLLNNKKIIYQIKIKRKRNKEIMK